MNDSVKETNNKNTDNDIPDDSWMIRSCHEYREELYDCESRQGRRYQDYVYGTSLNCSQWKTDYENCQKFAYSNDVEAARELIASEERKRQYRLKCARANDVWSYRKTPPQDWNIPLKELKEVSHREASHREAGQNEAHQSEAGQSEDRQNVASQSESISREATIETVDEKSRCAVS